MRGGHGRCNRSRHAGRWLIVFIWLALTGCASTGRLPPPTGRLNTALPAGFDQNVRFAFDSIDTFERDSASGLTRIRRAAPNGHINLLALSGGGAGGAFGAGVLVGWTQAGARPEFQIVTGVSVGALIAPFAFLGPSWDTQLTQALSGQGSRTLLQRHLLGLLFDSSVYSGEPLRELVHHFVTAPMLEDIAREYRRGRMLFIETTDLDKGEPVIWNMGAIAARGGPAALRLFRQVLVASASIPGVFPPVLIRVRQDGRTYEEMHVDGGASAPMFIAPEIAALVSTRAKPLGDATLYVIFNGTLGRPPKETPLDSVEIATSGLHANLTHAARTALIQTLALARSYGLRFEATAVPSDYPFGGTLDFEPAHMRRLFDYAMRCTQSGALWTPPTQLYQASITASTPAPNAEPACPGQVASKH